MDNQTIINEYRDREIRWTEKALDQLSFFNNLLLTLSVGFLAFAFKEYSFSGLKLTVKHIDWPLTFAVFSVLIILLDVIIGLFVAINRLYDFRLTRQINQIRHRMFKHSTIKLDDSSPKEFSFQERIFLVVKIILNGYPKITMEECKSYNSLDDDKKNEIINRFKALRNITHNLGTNTWQKTVFQITFFGIGIIFLHIC